MNPVTDSELIEAARQLIRERFVQDRHHIAAALRTRSGKSYVGVHLEAYVGRVAVCAEAVALGAAATHGDTEIETIVAVNELGEIVSPCGICRELISDYSREASVLLPAPSGFRSVPVLELLPEKYHRT